MAYSILKLGKKAREMKDKNTSAHLQREMLRLFSAKSVRLVKEELENSPYAYGISKLTKLPTARRRVRK